MNNFKICFLVLTSLFLHFAVHSSAPHAIYLTWQKNPESRMMVHWVTGIKDSNDHVEYRLEGEEEWQKKQGYHKNMPEEQPYKIHHLELKDLKPRGHYQFRIVTDGKIYKFRTMPTDLRFPIKFIVGGDIYTRELAPVREMNKQAAKLNPHFALIGGDIAYTAFPERRGFLRPGPKEKANRWLEWLSAWQKDMVTPDGFLIPMVPAIGNHETMGFYNEGPDQALFFYALFPIASPENSGYYHLDFSDYISIFVLDSGHTHSVKGNQKTWLENTLRKRESIPHKFALYHVGAYPSIRDYTGSLSSSIRNEWVPIFDQYGLSAAFEHHDHAFKRTHLLRHNKIDPKGVLYIGDGAWGAAEPRKPKREIPWYVASFFSKQHVILVTVGEGRRTYHAIDVKGEVFDEFSQGGD